MLSIEFGSQQRGDYNYSSDIDLLLIDDCIKDLLSEKEVKKALGYSVTCFPTDKAKLMIQKGSLFFKHIIEEGNIVDGDKQAINNMFNRWAAPNNYNDEIDGNLHLLELLSHVPKTHEGLLVAADMVTISIRNILIRQLASEGEYIFSWQGISNEAIRLNLIDINDQSILIHARKIKNLYRQGYKLKISIFFVERLLVILNKISKKQISLSFDDKRNIVKLPETFNEGTYQQLRSIELLCVCYGFSNSPSRLLEEIKDPNTFSNHSWEINRLGY